MSLPKEQWTRGKNGLECYYVGMWTNGKPKSSKCIDAQQDSGGVIGTKKLVSQPIEVQVEMARRRISKRYKLCQIGSDQYFRLL